MNKRCTMTREQIEQTEWAKQFKEGCLLSSYEQALNHALALQDKEIFADIYRTDENGERVWAICVEDDFWMDAFRTQKEAVALCKQMGWGYTVIRRKR